MNRRRFLQNSAGAVALGLGASCGTSPNQQGRNQSGTQPTVAAAPTAGTNLLAKFVGLNAFVRSNAGPIEVALVNATDVPLPDGSSKVHQHAALLAVATSSYVKHEPSSTPKVLDKTLLADAEGKWCLASSLPTDAFYVWELRENRVSFAGIKEVIKPVESYVIGAIPFDEVSGMTLVDGWPKKKEIVDAVVELTSGTLTDSRSRNYPSGAHKKRWKLENDDAKPPNGITRRLGDVINYNAVSDNMITISWSPLAGGAQTGAVTVKGDALILFLHLPYMMSEYEKKQWHHLHHARSYYRLVGGDFSANKLKDMVIPRTQKGGGLESDPVFCPPASYELL